MLHATEAADGKMTRRSLDGGPSRRPRRGPASSIRVPRRRRPVVVCAPHAPTATIALAPSPPRRAHRLLRGRRDPLRRPDRSRHCPRPAPPRATTWTLVAASFPGRQHLHRRRRGLAHRHPPRRRPLLPRGRGRRPCHPQPAPTDSRASPARRGLRRPPRSPPEDAVALVLAQPDHRVRRGRPLRIRSSRAPTAIRRASSSPTRAARSPGADYVAVVTDALRAEGGALALAARARRAWARRAGLAGRGGPRRIPRAHAHRPEGRRHRRRARAPRLGLHHAIGR
jgi:hypothetical protein